MLLTIDIGNTSTKFALFESGEILERIRIPTVRVARPDEIVGQTGDLSNRAIEGIAISSVVRELRETFEQLAVDDWAAPLMFVDHSTDFGFPINYDPPADCGPDRLVAAYAAVKYAGNPVIVCDFGTATTIDLVTPDGYMGGIIAPGIETMADSLYKNTSRLPKIEVKPAIKVVGDSTAGSIRSGVFFGYVGLVDGIISRMQSGLDAAAPVISTGGYAHLIASESMYVDSFDADLIHRGLHDLWHGNN